MEQYIELKDTHLKDYPLLFCRLQEYALIPCVGRRIERLHGLVKRQGSHAFGISMPQLCAATRENENLQRVRENDAFREFCLQKWHGLKAACDGLLTLRVDPYALKAMTVDSKIQTIYQCSIQCEFDPVMVARQESKAFSQLAIANRREPAPLADAEKMVVDYFKGIFKPGNYYSMPLEMWMGAISDVQSVAPAARDILDQSLVAVSQPDIEIGQLFQGLHQMFVVTNVRPENRKVVRVDHLETRRTTVQVVRCEMLPDWTRMYRQTLCVERLASADAAATLDLRCMTRHVGDALRKVVVWRKLTQRARPRFKALANTELPPHDISLPPPICDEVGSGAPPPQALAPLSTHIAADSSQQEMDSLILALTAGNHYSGQQSYLPWAECPGVSMTALEALEKAGAVVLRQNEFAEPEIAVRPEALVWSPAPILHQPLTFCRAVAVVDNPLAHSKLALMLHLECEGFAQGAPEAPLTRDSPREYRVSPKIALSYYACLVSRQIIWDKGVASINHYGSDNYWRCLLRMNTSQLAKLEASMEGKQDAWFKRQLGAVPADQMADKEGSGDEGGDGGAATDDEPLPVEADLSAPVVINEIEDRFLGWTRKECQAGPEGEKLRIYFDNGTTRSGYQQAWLPCTIHERCIRWRKIFDTQTKFCSYMLAWHADGRRADMLSKKEHMRHEPSAEDVSAIEQQLIMRDF